MMKQIISNPHSPVYWNGRRTWQNFFNKNIKPCVFRPDSMNSYSNRVLPTSSLPAINQVSTVLDSSEPQNSKTYQKTKKLSKRKSKKLAREADIRQAFETSFAAFYEPQYGVQRWKSLYEELKVRRTYCAMINKYTSSDRVKEFLESKNIKKLSFFDIPCYLSNMRFPAPLPDTNKILDYYPLDAASILVTQALNLKHDDFVLDACAAPGGKSLAILQHLSLNGFLTANEPDTERRFRLIKLINDYIPSPQKSRISVISKFSKKDTLFDKVLVDAPCSAERHLISNFDEIERWNERKSKRFAKKQLGILCDAVKTLKIGGLLVYATCSVSRMENDDVVERFLSESWVPLELAVNEWPIGERTKLGWIVLPDRYDGMGPMYISTIKRVGEWKDNLKHLQETREKAKKDHDSEYESD
ncbi:hypothetical protein G9A89_007874 [Geosiphon pyriformis]|nr:hypothetical protein G9A89_007874 [Geosiphon pyriformis]